MKKIFFISDYYGTAEGVFAEDGGECLGLWSGDDATWRDEYFNGFMKKLGIKVIDPPPDALDLLHTAVREQWGEELETNGET